MPRFGLRIRNDNILLQSGSTNRVLGAMVIKICDMQGLEVGQRPRLRGGRVGGTKSMSLEVRLEGMINQNIFTEPIEVTRVLLILVFWCSAHGPTLVGLHQRKGYSNVTAQLGRILWKVDSLNPG